jgi:hypothetical protein
LSSRTAGRAIRIKMSIGGATATARASARRKASDLGTSSPTVTWKYVMKAKPMATAAMEAACAESDAELDGGEEVLKLLLKATNGPCAGNLGGEELLDAGVAGADHGKFGGHKESVGQNQHGDGDNLEKR